jgi:hypothetical protein
MDKQLTPKTANTFNKICKLKRDNVSTRFSWISISPNGVHIRNQKSGHPSTGQVDLTRKEFERFIRFYETGK